MIITELECIRNKQTAKDAEHLVKYGAKQSDAKKLVKYGAGKTKDAPASEGHSFFICANEIDCIEAEMSDEAISIDWHDAITELQSSYKHNPTVKHPFRHFVISIDENEHLADKEWRKVVRETMSHLGYDNARYIAFRHADTENSHVHITVSTQDLATNKVISNWFSIEKAQEKMREFEKEFGLKELENSKDAIANNNFLVSEMHTPQKIKMMMRRLVDNAICNMEKRVLAFEKLSSNHSDKRNIEKHISRSLPLFKSYLMCQGIEITLKEDAKNGKFSGLIYHFKDYSIPAGKLRSGNKYTIGGLVKRGVLDESSNLISSYNAAMTEYMRVQLDTDYEFFTARRKEAEHKAEKVKKTIKDWNKQEHALLIFSARKRYEKEVQEALDFWLYHEKKTKNKRMRPVLHAIYEAEIGIHKGSGKLTKFLELLVIMLFEISKKQKWDLRVTPVKTDDDIEALQDRLDVEIHNNDHVNMLLTHEKNMKKAFKERINNLNL